MGDLPGALILVTGGFIAVVALLARLVIRSQLRRGAVLRKAAGTLDIQFRDAFVLQGLTPKCIGRLDGVELEIAHLRSENRDHLRLVARGAIPLDLEINHESFATALLKTIQGADVEVGDPPFDRDVNLHGDEREILARMRDETRALLLDLMRQHRVRIHEGTLTVLAAPHLESTAIADLGRSVAKLCNALGHVRTTPALVHNALRDPSAAVRLRNLEALLDTESLTSLQSTLDVCLEDSDIRVRLLAAKSRHSDRATKVLVEIGSGTSELASAALDLALVRLDATRAEALVLSLLASRSIETVRAALTAAGHRNLAVPFDAIAKLSFAHESDAALLLLAVQAVTRCSGHPGAENFLIGRLETPDRAVRLAALGGLSKIGTATAIDAIRRFAEGRGGGLHSAAEAAIAEIQARYPGAHPGQLTIANPGDAGALSVTDTEAGALSIAARMKTEPTKR